MIIDQASCLAVLYSLRHILFQKQQLSSLSCVLSSNGGREWKRHRRRHSKRASQEDDDTIEESEGFIVVYLMMQHRKSSYHENFMWETVLLTGKIHSLCSRWLWSHRLAQFFFACNALNGTGSCLTLTVTLTVTLTEQIPFYCAFTALLLFLPLFLFFEECISSSLSWLLLHVFPSIELHA